MIHFTLTDQGRKYTGRVSDVVGALPLCWDPSDARDAITQHDERQMGNGPWSDILSAKWKFDPADRSLKYPGDRKMLPLAEAKLPLTDEVILVYQHAWVAIIQSDGSFTVDRRD